MFGIGEVGLLLSGDPKYMIAKMDELIYGCLAVLMIGRMTLRWACSHPILPSQFLTSWGQKKKMNKQFMP